MAQQRVYMPIIDNGAAETDTLFSELPIEFCPLPVARITLVYTREEAQQIIAQLPSFDWLCFTSANAVALFFALPLPSSIPHFPKIACIGPNTAEAVKKAGRNVDFIAKMHTGTAFVQSFLQENKEESVHVLLPRPKKVATDVEALLSAAGQRTTPWIMYENRPIETKNTAQPVFTASDWFVFRSPSMVRYFLRKYTLPTHALAIAIGPVTADALEGAGHKNIYTAAVSSRTGLVDALRACLTENR